MDETLLPEPFANLNVYLHWALPTTKERVRARVHSTMPALQEFYDAMCPHMDAIMAYLQDFPPSEADLEPPVRRLVHLAKAFLETGIAVELLHAPDESNVWGFEDMVLIDMQGSS